MMPGCGMLKQERLFDARADCRLVFWWAEELGFIFSTSRSVAVSWLGVPKMEFESVRATNRGGGRLWLQTVCLPDLICSSGYISNTHTQTHRSKQKWFVDCKWFSTGHSECDTNRGLLSCHKATALTTKTTGKLYTEICLILYFICSRAWEIWLEY